MSLHSTYCAPWFCSILRKYVLLWSKYLLWIWQHEQQTVNLYYYASISFTLKGNYYPIINHNFRTCLSCDPHIEKKDMILFLHPDEIYKLSRFKTRYNFNVFSPHLILSSFIKSAMLDKYVNYNHGLCKMEFRKKCLLKLYVEGQMSRVFYSKLIIELII